MITFFSWRRFYQGPHCSLALPPADALFSSQKIPNLAKHFQSSLKFHLLGIPRVSMRGAHVAAMQIFVTFLMRTIPVIY